MEPAQRPTFGAQVGQLGELLKRLVAAHLDLAKAEAVERLVSSARDAAGAAMGAALLGLGWVLTSLAVGVGLGERLGMARGLLIVAALHVVAGGGLAARYGRRLLRATGSERGAGLPVTRAVVQRDRAFLEELGRDLRRRTPHAP